MTYLDSLDSVLHQQVVFQPGLTGQQYLSSQSPVNIKAQLRLTSDRDTWQLIGADSVERSISDH